MPLYTPTGNPVAQTRVTSAQISAEFSLIATGLNTLPANTKLYSGGANYAVDIGVADAYIITVNASVIAYFDGMSIDFKAIAANATTTPTVNINGLGAKSIIRRDGTPAVAADITAGAIVTVKYSTTTGKFQLTTYNGINAINGTNGTNGAQGIQGITGNQGIQGMAGLSGTVIRSSRSTNTILGTSDSSTLIDLSSTFTQTLTAAATLANGWFCYLRNAGNGTITIDPNLSELVDGVLTYSLLPGYTILLTCNGTSFTVLVLKERTYPNVAQYTASSSLVDRKSVV